MSTKQNSKDNTITKSNQSGGILETIDHYDKYISGFIHRMSMPTLLQYYFLIFGQVFNKEGPLILLTFNTLILPMIFKTDQSEWPKLYFGMIYIGQGLTSLTFSIVLKKVFARHRPHHNKSIYRVKDIRGKEKCCAWPSGDTIQVCFIAFYMMAYYPELVQNYVPFGNFGMYLIILQVAFARMFFQCHYLGDVIGGAFFGILSHYLNHYIVVNYIMPPHIKI
eukprot:403372672